MQALWAAMQPAAQTGMPIPVAAQAAEQAAAAAVQPIVQRLDGWTPLAGAELVLLRATDLNWFGNLTTTSFNHVVQSEAQSVRQADCSSTGKRAQRSIQVWQLSEAAMSERNGSRRTSRVTGRTRRGILVRYRASLSVFETTRFNRTLRFVVFLDVLAALVIGASSFALRQC